MMTWVFIDFHFVTQSNFKEAKMIQYPTNYVVSDTKFNEVGALGDYKEKL